MSGRRFCTRNRTKLAALAALLVFGWPCSRSVGQAPGAGAATVARLSLIDGEAHVVRSGYNAEALDAVLNMPLSAGEALQTGASGFAEVEFPDGSVLRNTPNSAATIVRLQPEVEIGVDDGLYYLELRAGADSHYVLYAGELSITPKENASIRVRVQGSLPEVAVMRGSVSVTRQNSYTVDLQQGESLRTDSKDNRRYLLADTVGPESGDSWNERRAQQLADAAASQTIAREDFAGGQGYGWSDLDNSGAWYPLPGDGLVWQPYGVDASFDPYGYGSWVYGGFGAGGGYVWASGYPWGWLPYHCGAWGFFPGFGWGWQPAGGCASYGGGWPVGGFPVNHPPRGWRPPVLPTRPPSPNGIVVRHPTIPVVPAEGATHLLASGVRRGQPVLMNGVTLRPLSPLRPPTTARGSSAVGSALRRDFPIQNGTHLPLLGAERDGAAVLPGLAPEWRDGGRGQQRSQPGQQAGQVPATPSLAPGRGDAAEGAPRAPAGVIYTAPGSAVYTEGLSTGWRGRVLQAPSAPAGVPATGAGIAVAPHPGLRAVPAGAGAVPYSPQTPRAPIVVAPARPIPVLPAAPRVAAPSPPAPAPAPHFSAPVPASPAVHMSSPPAAQSSRPK